MDMLEDIGSAENIEPWLRSALERGERLMGFGHRVYKTRDPRALALREVVETMRGEDPFFDLSVLVEDTAIRLLDEYKPGRRLYTNVEYWAAAILRTVNIPKPLYTPTFSLSRTVGWTAHILEQAESNRLIRPQSVYVGSMPESYITQS
jgi:citrate synthase